MPVPPLPDKVVVLVFEHLWSIFSACPHNTSPIPAINPAHVYARLSRDPAKSLQLLKKYGVVGEVRYIRTGGPVWSNTSESDLLLRACIPSVVGLSLELRVGTAEDVRTTCAAAASKRPDDPPLRHLRLRDLPSGLWDFRRDVLPILTPVSAAHLRVLEISSFRYYTASSITATGSDIFRDVVFPNLTDLRLECDGICCGEADFFAPFPSIRNAAILLERRPPRITLPRLPSTLVSLDLAHRGLDLPPAQAMLRDQPDHSLRILSLSLTAQFSVHRGVDLYKRLLEGLSEVCDELGITFAGDVVDLLDEVSHEAFEPSSDDDSYGGGSTLGEESDLDELDYDAEDAARFCPLWSDWKQRTYMAAAFKQPVGSSLSKRKEPVRDAVLRGMLRPPV
ncbi:hypothetical protein JCM10449v2_000136 [Rhodotorula kratochvilovae]